MEIIEGSVIKVIGFNCGDTAKFRLSSMGIRLGSIIKIKHIQPIGGPMTIKVGRSEYTIGRGLFSKIIYEKEEKE